MNMRVYLNTDKMSQWILCFLSTLSVFSFARLSEAQGCRQIFTARHGVITSPFYPAGYQNNMDCRYVIKQPPGYHITFAFIDFELEKDLLCDYDYVEIHDGESLTSPLLGNRMCNETLSLELRTSLNVLLIHFKTDNSRTFRGFNASYSAECGGTFTSKVDTVIYLNTSDIILDCEFLIRQPTGHQIIISSFQLLLEPNATCNHSVQIFDDVSSTSPILANEFCNVTAQMNLRTTRNILLIRFKVQGSDTFTGFKASYRVECGGIFNSQEGEIMSPFYPDTYNSTIECVYKILQSTGYIIHLFFQNFKLGSNSSSAYNFLKIYDGGTSSAPLIGDLRYNDKLPLEFSSTQKAILIHLRATSNNGPSRWFYALYKTDNKIRSCDARDVQPHRLELILSECGGNITDRQGMISYLHPYKSENMECAYVISQPSMYRIKLVFSDVSFGNDSSCPEFIEIYDGNSSSSPLLDKIFCNRTLLPVLMSTQNVMLIRFMINGSETMRHFKASYTSSMCGGNFTAARGIFSSPFYPDNYVNNWDCDYIISQPPSGRIRISFVDFDQGMDLCSSDVLQIYDGQSSSHQLLGNRLCNTTLPPVMTSTQNIMLIHFKTGVSGTYRGFQASYNTENCGGNFTTSRGNITSPFYPNIDANSFDCVYVISQPSGHQITLSFTDFDLGEHAPCTSNYLEIHNGWSLTSPLIDKRFCNAMTPPELRTTFESVFLIHFKTDGSGVHKGFSASFTSNGCGGLFTARQGVITSPFYPQNYGNDKNCQYIIRQDIGFTITLSFLHFELETQISCAYDYVEVHEGETLTTPKLGKRMCNIMVPLVLKSARNSMLVHFRSDDIIAKAGFKASYTTECGEVMRTHSGMIATPLYSHQYSNSDENLICRYVIWRPVGHKITLSFLHLNLQTDGLCDVYVEIHDGENVSFPLLGHRICNNTLPLVLTSSQNAMVIHFKTVRRIERGFNASYTSEFRSSHPVITGYRTGEMLQEGNNLTIICSVKGSNSDVDTLIFFCSGHPDTPDIEYKTEIKSMLTINPINANDDGNLCICTVVWKTTSLERLNSTVILNVNDDEMKWMYLLNAGGVVSVTLASIITVVIINDSRSSHPVITGYRTGELLQERNNLTMICSVKGSNSDVDTLTFSCRGQPDTPDTEYKTEIKCMLTINPINASDDGNLYVCTAVWKTTSLERLNSTVILNVNDDDEMKRTYLLIAGGLVFVALALIIIIVIIKGRCACYCWKGKISNVDSQNTNDVQQDHPSSLSWKSSAFDGFSISSGSNIYYDINDIYVPSQDDLSVEDTKEPELHSASSAESSNGSSSEMETFPPKLPVRSSNEGYLHPINRIIPLKLKMTSPESSENGSIYGEYLHTVSNSNDLQRTNIDDDQHDETDDPQPMILLSVAWTASNNTQAAPQNQESPHNSLTSDDFESLSWLSDLVNDY